MLYIIKFKNYKQKLCKKIIIINIIIISIKINEGDNYIYIIKNR